MQTMGEHLVFCLALFRVEIPKELYTAEHGSNVTLECDFYSEDDLDVEYIQASLQKLGNNTSSNSTTLLKEQLPLGKVLFHFPRVQLSDAGKYRCVIVYRSSWDYKYLTLKVKGE